MKEILINILIVLAITLFCYGFYYNYFVANSSFYETECVPNYMGGCDL